MARIADRLRRLESRMAQPAAPNSSLDDVRFLNLFLKQLNRERYEIDMADREALGNASNFLFGDDGPEPEPLTEAEERELDRGDPAFVAFLEGERERYPAGGPDAVFFDRMIADERSRIATEGAP